MSPARFAELVLARMLAVVAALVGAGWPAISAWWRDAFGTLLRSGVRQLCARVGRRGGKSSSGCIFAVSFALVYATLGLVPPGDIGWVVFVSVNKDEAAQRLRTIDTILRTIGVPFTPDGDTIVIAGTNVGFRVQACTVASVSGWTTILVILDEVAKWRDRETGANPASDVIAAIRPTMATQPLARMILLSSPVGAQDAHAKAFAQGDSDFQRVAHAPTWVANPTVTEQATHDLEPDARVWSREYAAEPQAASLAAFDAEMIDQAFEPVDVSGTQASFGIIDASSGKKDTWAYGVAAWRDVGTNRDRGSRKLVFSHIDGIEGRFWDQDAGDVVVARVAAAFKARGVRRVYGDQRESLMLAAAFGRNGLRFEELPWTAARKERAVMVTRRWLADGVLVLPRHEKLRAELLGFEEKITTSGGLTFGGGRGVGGHDDYVALILTCAMADSEVSATGRSPLPGSPVGKLTMAEALQASIEREEADRRIGLFESGGFSLRDMNPEDVRRLRRWVP